MSDVLVGRVVEAVRISEVLDRAADQRPTVVLLVGEAGVGKTTLLREALRRAQAQDFAVAVGAAVPGASGLAFGPVRAAARALPVEFGAERVSSLVHERSGVEVLIPSDVEGSPHGPETAELYVRFLGVISELTEDRPLLLALEDLHWADRSTLELLSFLVRNLSGERLAIVATMRSDDVEVDPYNVAAVAELSRLQGVERIDLDRFGRAELRSLALTVLGTAPDDELLDDLVRRSEGNPFFAIELLTTGLSEGLPPSVAEVVDLRLGLVPDRHRQLLRAASVVGPMIDPALVAAYLDRPAEEIDDALRSATDANILVIDPVDGTLRFRHALLQERAYGQLLAGERRRLHDRLADALAGDPATPPAVLAFHLERAHRTADALTATLAAARQAAGDHGTVDAVHHYRRVVDLWHAAEDPEQILACSLVDVLEEGVACAMNVGVESSAEELVQILVDELDPAGDAERWVRHAAALSELYWETGRAEESGDLLRRAHELLPADEASPAAVRLHERLSYTALSVGDYATADAAATEAVAYAEQLDDPELLAVALGRLGLVHTAQGRGAALDELRRAVALAQSTGPGHEAARATINFVLILHIAGDMRACASAVDAVLDDLDHIAIGPVDRAMFSFVGARVDTARGRFQDAADRLAGPIVPSAKRYREYRLIAEAELAVATGDLGRAAATLHELELVDEVIPALHRACAEAELALRTGRHVDVVRIVDDHLPIATLVPEVTLLRLCAQGIEGASPDDPVIDHYRSMAESKYHELARHAVISSAHVEGLFLDVVNVHAGSTGSVPADGARAAERFEEAGQQLRANWARYHHARALVGADGDRGLAAVELSRAHHWAVRAGATPLRAAIEELVRRARLEIPGIERLARDDLGLTSRETEVLRLVASGRTNREIAEQLYISPKTASVHVSNILRKVGATNRGEAAAVAHRHGLDRVG